MTHESVYHVQVQTRAKNKLDSPKKGWLVTTLDIEGGDYAGYSSRTYQN